MLHDTKDAQTISPLAGKPATRSILVDLARIEREYYQRKPDLSDPAQRVSFGTSGHRGSSLRGSFTEEQPAEQPRNSNRWLQSSACPRPRCSRPSRGHRLRSAEGLNVCCKRSRFD